MKRAGLATNNTSFVKNHSQHDGHSSPQKSGDAVIANSQEFKELLSCFINHKEAESYYHMTYEYSFDISIPQISIDNAHHDWRKKAAILYEKLKNLNLLGLSGDKINFPVIADLSKSESDNSVKMREWFDRNWNLDFEEEMKKG